jgi:putative Holliday junction resolvase
MRKGRRLAVDVGRARVGLALSDIDGFLASPFETVSRAETLDETALAIAAAVENYDLLEIYVGLPISLGGGSTPSTQDAINLAYAIRRRLGVEVRFIDERLSTVSASANLRLAGRTAKNSRSVIDQEAAAIILEQALAIEKSTLGAPGQPIESQQESTHG